ncbi:MAG: hypothetical protein ACREFO_01460 [Acetobacteraceae bacterium]
MAGIGQDDRAHACCEAIRDQLSRRLPHETIFFGPAIENQNEPAIVALRARGAHSFWVALPIEGVVFWDAHVGIVIDPVSLTGTIGVHRRRGSTRAARLFTTLMPLFRARGLGHTDAEAADEEQWICKPRDLAGAAAIIAAGQDLAELFIAVRQRLAAGGT